MACNWYSKKHGEQALAYRHIGMELSGLERHLLSKGIEEYRLADFLYQYFFNNRNQHELLPFAQESDS